MRVADIREHFVSQCGWVDPDHTVDRVIIGDPALDADGQVSRIQSRDEIDIRVGTIDGEEE